MRRITTTLFVATLFMLGGVSNASAALILTLQQGGDWKYVSDLTDGHADGVVSYAGPVGAYELDVTWGMSEPIIGGVSFPQLALGSVSLDYLPPYSSGSPLIVTLKDDGFMLDAPSGALVTAQSEVLGGLSGPTGSTIKLDNSIVLTGGVIAGPTFTFSPGMFSQSQSTTFTYNGNPFALISQATIDLTGPGGSAYFSQDLLVHTPEPTSVLLLGTGLLGLIRLGPSGLLRQTTKSRKKRELMLQG